MEANLPVEYWNDIWKTKKTSWEDENVNKYLMKYSNSHLKLEEGPKKVFVPLCGKTLDLKWFYENGHTVVGLDFAAEPVIEFYETHGYSYTKIKTSYGYRLENEDRRLIIHLADLYAMDASILGVFDVIWDRGSLITQSKSDIKRYADLMKSLMTPNCNYMVEVYQFEGKEPDGVPPLNITSDIIEMLFNDVCEIKYLEKYDCSDDEYFKNLKIKIEQIFRAYFYLTPRKSTDSAPKFNL